MKLQGQKQRGMKAALERMALERKTNECFNKIFMLG